MSVIKRSIQRSVICVILVFFGAGCAITTTYGVKPEQDSFDPDVYTFTVYYNMFSGEEDIAKNANKQIEKFISEHDYVDHKIMNVSAESGKSLYEVKFYREQQQ